MLRSFDRALDDFSFRCIDQVQAHNNSEEIDRRLITKEAYWSAQLFSLAPYGLNKRKEFHEYLLALFLNFVSFQGVYYQYFRAIYWSPQVKLFQ